MLVVHFRAQIGLLFFAFVMQVNIFVGAQSNFRWVPLVDLAEEEKLRITHLSRSRCLPNASDVSVPIHPSAVVVDIMWGRVRPTCELRQGWDSLGGVRLVSKKSFQDVLAWYRQHLVGYSWHKAPTGVIFIREEIKDYLWDRDYYKHANISIHPSEDGFLASGYVTEIEINRPAK